MLSTFAVGLMPDHDAVVRRAAEALAPGRRLVLLDLKEPERVPGWLIRLGVALTRPFGVEREYAARRPWESMRRYFADVRVDDVFFGFAYLAAGRAARP